MEKLDKIQCIHILNSISMHWIYWTIYTANIRQYRYISREKMASIYLIYFQRKDGYYLPDIFPGEGLLLST